MTVKRCRLASIILLSVICSFAVHAEDERPPMPPMTIALNATPYPAPAVKSVIQGRVLVAFNITKKGRADSENVVDAEPLDVFESTALSAVRKVKFAVPPDWEEKAGPLQRYRLSVVFKLYPCPPESCTTPKAHDEADDFIIISAQAK